MLRMPAAAIFASFAVVFAIGARVPAVADETPNVGLQLTRLEPTVFFPKPEAGKPLEQIARLGILNRGNPVKGRVIVSWAGGAGHEQPLGMIGSGESLKDVRVPDLAEPAELKVTLVIDGEKAEGIRKTFAWQPQRKWKIYCVSYSHHDLGFGDYPHRLRTTIRHANIERPLRFCQDTDSWDDDSKFRFIIETSEPIPSFLGSCDERQIEELARRIREGRIQIGAVHNTANTEQLGHELLARLFYLTNRHCRDLLDIPASRTAQIDDVIGLTWPLATMCYEANVPYLFHGHNHTGRCMQPASKEPVFRWLGPDGHGSVLVRSTPYGGYSGDSVGDGSEKHIEKAIDKFAGPNWPYDVMLLQEGTDFQLVTCDTAKKIRAWNARWAHPRLICSTMDMFFDALVKAADPAKIKTFAKDANNHWADQDASDAWLLGQARRQGEALSAAEKWATIASVLGKRGYPWAEVYQAYHRLLAYHEHTNAIDFVGPDPERMQQYETELEENREMVADASHYRKWACFDSLKVGSLITTHTENMLIVFNPTDRSQTGPVSISPIMLPMFPGIVDAENGQRLKLQRLRDGSRVFVAPDIPSMGYRTYEVTSDFSGTTFSRVEQSRRPTVVENQFYRAEFDERGAIKSLRDKQLNVELVDQAAPHRFNEYLYERYETPDRKVASKWYRVESAEIEVQRGPVVDIVTVTAKPTGVKKLCQKITFYNQLKRIDFELDMVKSPSGRTCSTPETSALNQEAVYVALPFSVPGGRFVHQVPGGVVEPIRGQFDGSGTAHYATRHFADVSNGTYGATVSSVDASLVQYGRPRSCPIPGARQDAFEKVMEYPQNSRMYLMLADNMFDTNIRWDQAGAMKFSYSITSHVGDWRQGKADEFGHDVHCPLYPVFKGIKSEGSLPGTASLFSVDRSNVMCTTIKPAEANGRGIILRFMETRGEAAEVTASLPFFGEIGAAIETDLVENDRPVPVAIQNGHEIKFAIRPFGVKTIRVVYQPEEGEVSVQNVKANAKSDMEIRLVWQTDPALSKDVGHYRIYRGKTPDFKPSLLNLVQRSAFQYCTDSPQLRPGWINNRLTPDTEYFYRVAAVDRWNNEGPLSPPVRVRTMKTSEKDMRPLPVHGLRAIHVSPLGPCHYVNLLFGTNCEADIVRYEVFRGTQHGFELNDAAKIGTVECDAVIKGSTVYGHTPVDYRVRDFDHAMYQDKTARPGVTYYYKVLAVDRSGQRAEASQAASICLPSAGK